MLNGNGDFAIIGAVKTIASTIGTHAAGIYLRNGTSVYTALLQGFTALRCELRVAVSTTSVPTAIAQITINAPIQPTWFRIQRVGTTLNFHTSMDGQTWVLFGSSAVGTKSFTHCGFFGEQRASSGWSVAQCDSFTIE